MNMSGSCVYDDWYASASEISRMSVRIFPESQYVMWLRWVVSSLLSQVSAEQMRQFVAQAADPAARAAGSTQEGATAGSEPLPAPDVAVLFAVGLESGGLVDLLSRPVTTRCPSFTEHIGLLRDRPVVVAESGIGCRAAERAAEDLVRLHHPQWIISAGFAGGLTPELARLHILMADSVIDARNTSLEVGFRISPEQVAATPGLHVGRLVTVDRLVRDREERLHLARQFQAVACDMETMAVAEVCRRHRTRFLSVRVISDGLDDQLPPELERLVLHPSAAGKLGAATRAIWQRPGIVKDMWRLRETAQRATDRLARFLTGVIPQLQSQENR